MSHLLFGTRKRNVDSVKMDRSDIITHQSIFADASKKHPPSSLKMEVSEAVKSMNARISTGRADSALQPCPSPCGSQSSRTTEDAPMNHATDTLDASIEAIVGRFDDRLKLAYTNTSSQPCFGPILGGAVCLAKSCSSQGWSFPSSHSESPK